jgi:hypothetical protein
VARRASTTSRSCLEAEPFEVGPHAGKLGPVDAGIEFEACDQGAMGAAKIGSKQWIVYPAGAGRKVHTFVAGVT